MNNKSDIKKEVVGRQDGYIENHLTFPVVSGSLTYSFPEQEKKLTKELRPEKIIFNDRTTIVIWNDKTKTIATCAENDIFDEKIGLASCLLKKMYGKKVHGKKLFERMLTSAERQYVRKTHVYATDTIAKDMMNISREINKLINNESK